jgi:hypothetical protein
MLDVRVLVLLHSNAHKLVNLISNSHHSWRNQEGRWDGGIWFLLNASTQVSSRFGVLPGFSPIFLHNLLCATGDGFRSRLSSCITCLVLLVMGLDLRFLDFFSEGSPLCGLCFWVWSFVWTCDTFFFLLLFTCLVFCLYLFSQSLCKS